MAKEQAKRATKATSKTAAVTKAAPKRRVTKKVATATTTYEDIATRAYFLHLEHGGDAFENWLRAERELVAA